MRPEGRLVTIFPPALSHGGSMAARRKGAARARFKLASPDIRPNGPIAMEQVFNGFGCSGQNISPALKWSGAPEDTNTFALLLHDPRAPTPAAGGWHWLAGTVPASGGQT